VVEAVDDLAHEIRRLCRRDVLLRLGGLEFLGLRRVEPVLG
jgi:hypothetical protein